LSLDGNTSHGNGGDGGFVVVFRGSGASRYELAPLENEHHIWVFAFSQAFGLGYLDGKLPL